MSSETLMLQLGRNPERFRGLRDFARGVLESVRFAKGALVSHKLRSSLTVLGIVIGVATVIAMVSIIEGFNRNVIGNLERFGATLVQFQKFDSRFGPGGPPDESIRNRRNLTYEDAVALRAMVPDMAAVSPERYWFPFDGQQVPLAKYGGEEAQADTLVGVNEDYPAANNQFVGEGRFITGGDIQRSAQVAVIGANIAETLFAGLDPLGKKISIAGRTYTVVGVMEKQGQSFFESVDQHLYLPITTFDSHFPWIKRNVGVNIATIPKRADLMQKIMDEGTQVLRIRRKVPFDKPNDFGIRTNDAMVRNFKQITGGIAMAMVFIAGISLLVGGVGVMNIMLVTVTERTREIGIRKAIGAVRRDIVTQFLTEAMTLSAIGGVIGISIGLAISLIVRKVSPLATATPLWSIFLGLGVSVSIGLFFGIYPAWKAAKLDPVEALRYE
ncbi:MAG: ABC transporter permease [Thermoanaerobaculia bacterium]